MKKALVFFPFFLYKRCKDYDHGDSIVHFSFLIENTLNVKLIALLNGLIFTHQHVTCQLEIQSNIRS